MALIAALLPDAADRDAFEAAASGHRLTWADDWRDLIAVVKREPASAAVADLHAEPGKDGALRVLRFSRRYPGPRSSSGATWTAATSSVSARPEPSMWF